MPDVTDQLCQLDIIIAARVLLVRATELFAEREVVAVTSGLRHEILAWTIALK
jgi:hypothetical protein